MLIAEKCANKSSPPSSGVMKPKPLESLNHLTVPVAIKRNHTSHKSKKLLAPSSTPHFLSTSTFLHGVDNALLADQFLKSSAFVCILLLLIRLVKKQLLFFAIGCPSARCPESA